jgi:hypothetical protein
MRERNVLLVAAGLAPIFRSGHWMTVLFRLLATQLISCSRDTDLIPRSRLIGAGISLD